MIESRKRSVVKAISWRMAALIAGSITTYAVLGDLKTSIRVMIWANIVSTIVYYIHERFWSNIHYGRKRHDDKPSRES